MSEHPPTGKGINLRIDEVELVRLYRRLKPATQAELLAAMRKTLKQERPPQPRTQPLPSEREPA